ncbi:MAG TPA: efflux RND transporter periplasmic adaptor subunit [Candidatus Acidoferrales bacterium]|nr:efflux RND transporter periplasmic adaptor subunit [Candidatus Acidoferrales bacterium]
MRFGPTSLRASSILAKGLRRPKFRTELRVSEQTLLGEKSYVVKVPETNSYNRYGATEYELLTLCDGTRTAADVAAAWNERYPDSQLGDGQVSEFLDSVEPGMWEQSLGEKNLAVLQRIREDRKSRLDQSSMLYLTFKAWDPNRTLEKMDPYLGWMFTRGFVIFSVLLFVASAYLLAGDWAHVKSDTAALYTFAGKTAYDIWIFWILLFALGGIHEFGHGLTCKHFGGEVHQMGFMLIYFTPAFYTDTTDSVLCDRSSRRQWVLFAGIWIELVVCGICVFIWRFTVPGTFINDLAYKALLLSGIQGALLNLNPLIKADGYYALSEFLHVDNLREESFAFLRSCFRKYVLREDMELTATTRRLRRIYFIFGMTAIVYSTLLTILAVVFVRNVFVSKFGDWGYLLTLAVVYLFARKGVRKAVPQVRAWWREKQEEYMAWKMTRAQSLGGLGVALLLLIPPIPSRVASDFVLQPGRDAHVRAAASGDVRQVFVRQGDHVEDGQLLASLENPEIEARAQALAQQLALANSNVRSAQARANQEMIGAALATQASLQEEWRVAQKKADALMIRAPFAGIVSTPGVEQKTSEYVSAGDEFCEIVDRTTMEARILVHDFELEDVAAGTRAQLKVVPYPYRTYAGSVDRILPAAAQDRPVAQPQQLTRLGQDLTNYFAVVMEFPNPDGSLTEGMTGTAKISGKTRPLAWQAARGAWRWVRSQIW